MRLTLTMILLAGVACPQSTKVSLQITSLAGINSTWPGEGSGCPNVVNNQSSSSRRNIYHSLFASGSGTWTAKLQYSRVSCAGPWTDYATSAAIDQTSSPAIAYANDPFGQPASFIRILLTGNVVVTYVAQLQLPLSAAVGSVTFPCTLAQGCIGLTNIAAHGLIIGNGAGVPNVLTPGFSGYALVSAGSSVDPSYQAVVLSFNGRTGAVSPQSGDYSAAQVTNAVSTIVSYPDPSWITSLSWSKITGVPSLVSSFKGRTGVVVPTSGDYNAGQVTNAVDSTLTYPDPSWISTLSWTKIVSAPSLVNTFSGRSGTVVPTSGDYTWSLITGTKQGNTNIPQMALGSFVSGHALVYDINGNAIDSGIVPGGGGGGSVTTVFGQTGAVNIPVTTTDISTPANPSAGDTTWYTKGGVLCSLSPAGAENCTGGGGGAVSSVFGQTGVVDIAVTTTDISTPAAPAASHTKWYTKGGLLCSLNPSAVENCTGGGGGAVSSVFGQTGVVDIPVTSTDISTPAAPASGHTKWYTKGGLLCSLNSSSSENCTGGGGGAVASINSLTGALTFSGTTNEIILTPSGGNTITFSTPQAIGTSSSPSFDHVYTTGTGFYAGGIQVIDNAQNGIFHNISISGACFGCPGSSSGITSINSMAGPAITIVGTTHQISVVSTSNTATISTPQNIDTNSDVTFDSVTTANTGTGVIFQDSHGNYNVDGNGKITTASGINALGGGPFAPAVLSVNGTIVIDNARVGHFFTISTGTINLAGDIVPAADNTYNLGSGPARFASGYFAFLNVTQGTPGSGPIVDFSSTSSTESVFIANAGVGYGISDVSATGSSFVKLTTASVNATGGTSVQINGHNSGGVGAQALVVNDTASAGSGITLKHGSTFDASWQAGSGSAALDVVNSSVQHSFIVYQSGHWASGGSFPSLSGAGSGSCSLISGSTDVKGGITCSGTPPGNVNVVFAVSYSSKPVCITGSPSGGFGFFGNSTTQVSVQFQVSPQEIDYICIQ